MSCVPPAKLAVFFNDGTDSANSAHYLNILWKLNGSAAESKKNSVYRLNFTHTPK